jgi:hypothetical protein
MTAPVCCDRIIGGMSERHSAPMAQSHPCLDNDRVRHGAERCRRQIEVPQSHRVGASVVPGAFRDVGARSARGHNLPFPTVPNRVGHRAINRRSGPAVGHPPASERSYARDWTGVLCQQYAFPIAQRRRDRNGVAASSCADWVATACICDADATGARRCRGTLASDLAARPNGGQSHAPPPHPVEAAAAQKMKSLTVMASLSSTVTVLRPAALAPVASPRSIVV